MIPTLNFGLQWVQSSNLLLELDVLPLPALKTGVFLFLLKNQESGERTIVVIITRNSFLLLVSLLAFVNAQTNDYITVEDTGWCIVCKQCNKCQMGWSRCSSCAAAKYCR
jgi:hypothetical protein